MTHDHPVAYCPEDGERCAVFWDCIGDECFEDGVECPQHGFISDPRWSDFEQEDIEEENEP